MEGEDQDSGCEGAQLRIDGLETVEELDDIIEATLNKLCFAQYPTPSKLQTKVRSMERKQREVNRAFTECDEALQHYHQDVAKSNAKIETIICMSDSDDDDIQVIDYQPSTKQVNTTPTLNKVPTLSKTISVPNKVPTPSKKPALAASGQLGRRPTTDNVMVPMDLVNALQAKPMNALQAKPGLQGKPTMIPGLRTMNLAVGMKLFAKKVSEMWYKGTLVDIIGKNEPHAKQQFKVKFDFKGMKVLSGMHIAYQDHPVDILPVGSRIIAAYKDEDSVMSRYAGIVAEPPSVRNNHRYLVFFDDGYAQYGGSLDIQKVYYQSKNVWEDIHPDSQDFIRGYLQQYPERPMVRLQKGQIVKTEWNGRWWVARVQEVDASLVKMHFEADRRVEWIYRGSTRLEPLYTELAHAEANKLAGKGRRHHGLNMQNMKGQQRKPIVEYTRGTEKLDNHGEPKQEPKQEIAPPAPEKVVLPVPKPVPQPQEPMKKRPVAKKSTANKNRINDLSLTLTPTMPIPMIPVTVQAMPPESNTDEQWWEKKTGPNHLGNAQPSLKRDRSTDLVIDLDSEDAMGERVGIKNILPKCERKRFISHLCGNHCIKDLELDMSKLRGNNPQLFPQLCGWERQITKQKNTGKRVVFYRSPCGRRMRDLEETDYFLMMTNSSLTIDYFCFDSNLHTDTEYVPVKTFCDIKDLSYGKETVPISCVNGIDRQYPDYVEYSNQRIPAKGVKLNLDENFLVGCSCVDGCRDASKCECIQMTLKASKAIPGAAKESNEEVGYEFRRLKESVVTGVYECNSRCKCDHRCWNRVAQHGLQLRLQVFKTEKRGWGLRCLDDIPEGGFICVYAGQLLTEQLANEDGQQYGDEYLAELDYMEVVERLKEGYESDVNEDEGIAEESDEDKRAPAAESDSTYSGERRHKKKRTTKCIKDVEKNELSSKQKTEEWLSKLQDDAIEISDEDEPQKRNTKKRGVSRSGSQSDMLPDLTEENSNSNSLAGLKITEPTSLNTDNIPMEDSDEDRDQPATKRTSTNRRLRRSTRSTSGVSRFRNLPDPKSQKPVSPLKIHLKKEKSKKQKAYIMLRLPTRKLFGEEYCYVMDAKSMGNLGRYLNHSCTPNAFVQNVFVDTHDLRFPWVAFFAYSYIRAGTELTWDYNYEVGSVPGKVLYCYCGSAECRGRLL